MVVTTTGKGSRFVVHSTPGTFTTHVILYDFFEFQFPGDRLNGIFQFEERTIQLGLAGLLWSLG